VLRTFERRIRRDPSETNRGLHAVFVRIARYFEARTLSMLLRKAGKSGHRTRGRQSGHPHTITSGQA